MGRSYGAVGRSAPNRTRGARLRPRALTRSQLFNWLDKDSSKSLDASELALASAALRPGAETEDAAELEASQQLLDTIAKVAGRGDAASGADASLDFAGFVRIMTMQVRARLLPRLLSRLLPRLPPRLLSRLLPRRLSRCAGGPWRCRRSPTSRRPRSCYRRSRCVAGQTG